MTVDRLWIGQKLSQTYEQESSFIHKLCTGLVYDQELVETKTDAAGWLIQ